MDANNKQKHAQPNSFNQLNIKLQLKFQAKRRFIRVLRYIENMGLPILGHIDCPRSRSFNTTD